MSLDAGRLRHRITIERPVSSDDSAGNLVTTWELVKHNVAAEVAPLSARSLSMREFVAAQSIQSKPTATITLRWRTWLRADMRIIHRGTIYNIEGVVPDNDSGLEWITLPVSSGVNDG